MASRVNYFLKKTLGEDFLESLQKVELWKPATKTVLDPQEINTALQIVPRTVMSLLIRELAPMAVGETKEIPLFVAANAMLHITKQERDVYSGHIEEDNKHVTEFKFRSLPGVGLVILSAFELYDMDTLKDGQHRDLQENADGKIQKLIDDRLALHTLVNQVVEQKLMQKDAVNNMLLMKLTEELEKSKKKAQQITELEKMSKITVPMDEEYFRGMANGIAVADACINDKEPDFVDAPKKPGDEGYTEDFSKRLKGKLKGSPLKSFLDGRKKKLKKSEFSIELAKGENVNCPDCGKNIFDGQVFSGCICLGDDMERKLFIKKSEDGIKIRFSKGWDQENIEMLLEILRRKHG